MSFLRQQGNFKKRIKKKWRKPKGHHSKLQEKRRGMHKMPSIAYKNPKPKTSIIIHNMTELKEQGKGSVITLASSIGSQKKVTMLDYCDKNGIIVSNYKDLKKKAQFLKESFKERQKTKKKKVKKEVKRTEPEKKKAVVKKKTTKSGKKVVVKKDKGDDQ